MKLQNIEVTNLTVYGLPIDFLSAPLGRKISGVIGNDILKQLVFEVDYASEVINFYGPESYNIQAPEMLCRLFSIVSIRLFVLASRLKGVVLLKASSRLTRDQQEQSHSILPSSIGIDSWILFPNQFSRGLGGVGGSAVVFSGRLKSMSWEVFSWRIWLPDFRAHVAAMMQVPHMMG